MLNLDGLRTIGILGDRDMGKTSIMISLARAYSGQRTVVFYSYPVEVLSTNGTPFRQIHTLKELELTTDSIIFMDELQKHIKFYQKRTSDEFFEILSVLAHNNNTLVFSTPMSQFITKALDVFIDGFIYVRISDMDTLKNMSKAKRLLQQFSSTRISTRTVRLDRGEYLQIVDGREETNGLHTFSNPGIQKAWRT